MGIPSYFSYIVKNHPEILEKFIKGTISVDNLYMDCNSIVYDAFYSITNIDDTTEIAKLIIKNVVKKIKEYLAIIDPKVNVIISFDGVAPMAKLEQQRTRRFKSWFQNKVSEAIQYKKAPTWSTASITPGTSFMKQLNKEINTQFKQPGLKPNIIVSTSDEVGEGEHKLFKFIRDNDHSQHNTVIYGLDADLIMLSINHLPLCKNIYLFRETPEFIKSIDSNLEPNDNYVLNIPLLADRIVVEMEKKTRFSEENRNRRLYDYIFISFLLGNDFLPHFPAVNIRTGGIDKLLQHYKESVGSTNQFLVDQNKIQWRPLRKFIESLSKSEHAYFCDEHDLRCKNERRYVNRDVSDPEKMMDQFMNIPNFERDVENYINPHKEHWEERYYTTLFHSVPSKERLKQICMNYFEGLEWTLRYYSEDCPDWRWCYKYHYPPLLKDLLTYIPYFQTEFIPSNNNAPVDQRVQLCYVLPKQNLSLLPYKIYNMLQTNFKDKYQDDNEFVWSYCKYFWECHVDLPELSIESLEREVLNV